MKFKTALTVCYTQSEFEVKNWDICKGIDSYRNAIEKFARCTCVIVLIMLPNA